MFARLVCAATPPRPPARTGPAPSRSEHARGKADGPSAAGPKAAFLRRMGGHVLGSAKFRASRGRPLRPVATTPPRSPPGKGDLVATGLQGLTPAPTLVARKQPRQVALEMPQGQSTLNTWQDSILQEPLRSRDPHILLRRLFFVWSSGGIAGSAPKAMRVSLCYCGASVTTSASARAAASASGPPARRANRPVPDLGRRLHRPCDTTGKAPARPPARPKPKPHAPRRAPPHPPPEPARPLSARPPFVGKPNVSSSGMSRKERPVHICQRRCENAVNRPVRKCDAVAGWSNLGRRDHGGGGSGLDAVFHPVALALDDDRFGVVQDAVEDS